MTNNPDPGNENRPHIPITARPETINELYASGMARAQALYQLEHQLISEQRRCEVARAAKRTVHLRYIADGIITGKNQTERDAQLAEMTTLDAEWIAYHEEEEDATRKTDQLSIQVDLEQRLFQLDIATLTALGGNQL